MNTETIINAMLEHIGSPDYELREKLIYPTFVKWIVEKPEISQNYLKSIIETVLDENHLFSNIKENEPISVFTRTFSVLLIPLLLINHRNNNFLSKNEIVEIFHEVSRYFLEETDLRGYVKDFGWAHSVAHTADALDDLALCSEIGYNELKYILEIIQIKICIGNYVYIDEEDERLVTAITSILGRNIVPSKEICKWIKSFCDKKNPDCFRYKDDMKMNIKNFLRSLYFRLLDIDEMEDIVTALKDVLNTISKY